MIYSVLQERELPERKAIIKLLGLILFQTPPMNEKEVSFLETLCAFSGLEDDDVAVSMRLDMRERWLFSEVIHEVLSLGSQKLLLFLAKLAENCFVERKGLSFLSNGGELKTFINESIEPNIHLSDKAKADMAAMTETFFKTSCDIYDLIYENSLSKKELETISASEKMFMLNSLKLNELSAPEATTFLIAFNERVMKQHDASSSGAEVMFLNHILGAFYQHADVTPDQVNEDPGFSLMEIQHLWQKKLILVASLARFEKDDDPLSDMGIRHMVNELDIDKKEVVKSIFPAVMAYKSSCIDAFSRLHDVSRDDYAAAQSGADYLRRALAVADVASDFVPGVAGLKKIHKWGVRASGFVDDYTSDDARAAEKIFGLRHIVEDNRSGVLNICIDGFMSEASKGQFVDWRMPFEASKVPGAIAGFSWPSRNFTTSGMTCWYEAVENALIYGNRLAEEIRFFKSFNPDIKIKLYGHSLGARVIQNSLVALVGSGCKVDEAYLFGGAVSRTDKQRWAGALQSVEGKVFNFYSSNDEILNKLYRMAQGGDEPAGLGEIEFFSSKGVSQCEVVNVDVTSLVDRHTEYKPNLVNILHQLNQVSMDTRP
ncbi:DUF726 domain-containing protein [Billgrantia montanilacus]|uniref:DUF726 domain-containing protein n=1 Tax=Billgrantia montanilacus TaxID=2282305 RepID=A0A368TZS8_9GAMM|nr:DUF726 domain-containing protein [Halomonas montanilacus]RCV89846.1 DUF726 domain-containing protein [Halomonas montanilacus]